jgi:hypothetical protein
MGPAVMAVAMVVSAAGAVASGVAASNQANYQAKVADQNAKYASEKANAGMADAAQKAKDKGLADKAHMGELEARGASSGIEGDSGSLKLVKQSQQQNFKTTAQEYGIAAAADWYANKKQQTSALAEGVLARSEAKNAQVKAGFSAAGSLLSGGSKMNENYGTFDGYFS